MTTDTTKKTEELRRTPISGVVALSADGRKRTLTVACPVRRHVVPFETCVDCERLRRVSFPDEDGRLYVVCDVEQTPRVSGGGDEREERVFDIMTNEIICARRDFPTHELLVLMDQRGLNAVPVVDEAERPIGMVTRADIVRLDERFALTPEESFDPTIVPELPHDVTVGEVMTPSTVVLHETDSVAQAAAALARHAAHRAPVVTKEGRVVGIVSALDIMQWLGARV